MHRRFFTTLLALLTLVAACKRTDPLPEAKKTAPKAEGLSKQAAESTPPGSTEIQQPAQPAVAQEGAADNNGPVRPPPPTIPIDELMADDPACAAKLERDEKKFRQEKLPRLIEEEQAVEVFMEWLNSSAEILEAAESARLFGLFEDGLQELKTCRKDVDSKLFDLLTMVSLPGDPEAKRMPFHYCLGSMKQDGLWCPAYLLRLGQWDLLDALWTDATLVSRYCNGAPASGTIAGEVSLANTLTGFAQCKVLLESDDCTPTALAKATVAARTSYANYCLAAQAGLRGESCGGPFAEGSESCALIELVKSGNGKTGCKEIAMNHQIVIPDVFCHSPKDFAEVDCKGLFSTKPPAYSELDTNSCEMARLARTHSTDCGSLPTPGPHCDLYLGYQSSINRHSQDHRMKMRGKFIFLSRAWARNIIQEPGVRLATLAVSPGQLGAPRDSQAYELQGYEPPPEDGKHREMPAGNDARPGEMVRSLLPDLWAETNSEDSHLRPMAHLGRAIDGEQHQMPPPPEGGEPGMPSPPPEGEHLRGPGGQMGQPGQGGASPQGTPQEAYMEGSQGTPPPGFIPGGPPPGPGGQMAPPGRDGASPTGAPPEPGKAPAPPEGEMPEGWASLLLMSPPLEGGKPPEGPLGKPGDKPAPEGSHPTNKLVTGDYVDPLTVTGGPIQQAMAEFARDYVQVPGEFSHRDDPPCAPYKLEEMLFTAADGGVMAEIRGINFSLRPLQCEFHFTLEGSEGRAEKTRTLLLPTGAVETLSVRFEPQSDPQLSIHEACIPVPEELPKKEQDSKVATAEKASPEPTPAESSK